MIDVADATDPPTPMYLEASAAGRPVYESLGYVAIPEEDHGDWVVMVRRGK